MKLHHAITHMYERDFQVKYNPNDEVLITVGVSEAVDLAMRAIFKS